jgi:outer membrane receptor protein involved in Fe transport
MSCSYLHSLALARVLAAVPVALVATAAGAQDAANPAVEPARQPAAAPAAVPAAAAAASAPDTPRATLERVEISGRRSDVDQRRQSTAAKIVVGREELDKYGDSSLGEVLRRLPGVTVPGAPGRGGAPRLRGLGGGYTQILLDGQRVPPGFSFDSIEPDQIERIEILRAPTAETGARAIAGTINIITREGFRRRDDELKLGFGLEEGRLSPGLNWTTTATMARSPTAGRCRCWSGGGAARAWKPWRKPNWAAARCCAAPRNAAWRPTGGVRSTSAPAGSGGWETAAAP